MMKLLSANFRRLWKNRIFWIGTAGMFIWGGLLLFAGALNSEVGKALDGAFFQYTLVIGGFCAVFTSLFLGTEYSDGTIRNKIVVGHTRAAVYLSNAVVCFVAGFIMNLGWILAMLVIGVPMYGWLRSEIALVAAYFIISMFMLAAYVSVFVLLCMLNRNKAGAAVITVLGFFFILFLGSYCHNRLSEPEIYSGGFAFAVIDNEYSIDYVDEEPNPDYLRGNKRKMFEFFVDFLPSGQGIQMSHVRAEHMVRMPLYSLFIVIAATASGVAVFRKKDLG